MEALPGVAHTVVYHGVIPVLCSKLIEISYIDLAEQTLSVCSTRHLITRIFLLMNNFTDSGEDLQRVSKLCSITWTPSRSLYNEPLYKQRRIVARSVPPEHFQ